jgi:hypothetical protein
VTVDGQQLFIWRNNETVAGAMRAAIQIDRQNWAHAIEHYQEEIARGADNPDVRTDLRNC